MSYTLKVTYTYFRQSGKFYTEAAGVEFPMDVAGWYRHKYIQTQQRDGTLPGLIVGGGKEFVITVFSDDPKNREDDWVPIMIPALVLE